MKKFVVIVTISFLIMPSFISANENTKAKTSATLNTTQEYPLYKKTVIIFGKAYVKDTFTTPPDCKKLMVSARVGPLFTADSTIYIGSNGWPLEVGEHTIWGTGWYILGQFVWPSLRVFYERWFTPGLQYVEITGTGA